EIKTARFAPEPQTEGAGPQKIEEIVRDFLRQHYHRLLWHARRHLRHDELSGDIPEGALDADDIVDDVVLQSEAQAQRKPGKMDWLVWIYHLLHEELRRQRAILKEKEATEVATEQRASFPELRERGLLPLEKIVK